MLRGYIGLILGLYWGYVGIMDKKMIMETTSTWGLYWLYIGFILWLCWDNGQENENGNYYSSITGSTPSWVANLYGSAWRLAAHACSQKGQCPVSLKNIKPTW